MEDVTEALWGTRVGDALVVWPLDRLGRSLKHLIEMISKLENIKVGFQSLQESVDATSSGGKLIFHILGALAEFERSFILERTKAGLAAAQARRKKASVSDLFDTNGPNQENE